MRRTISASYSAAPPSQLTLKARCSPGRTEGRSVYPTIFSMGSIQRQVVASQAFPAQFEDDPFRFALRFEYLAGRRDRIGRRRAELTEAIGPEAPVAQQHVVAFEGFGAHAVQNALQLRAVSAIGLPAKLLGKIQARRIDFVHAAPPVP